MKHLLQKQELCSCFAEQALVQDACETVFLEPNCLLSGAREYSTRAPLSL